MYATAAVYWAVYVLAFWARPIPAEIQIPTFVLAIGLISLSVIDRECFILPDWITMPLAAIGFISTYWHAPIEMPAHALGAVAGMAGFLIVGRVYAIVRGRQGLGLGDVKFFGALGAWLGIAALPTVLLFASCLGLACAAADRLKGNNVEMTTRVPFGAHLALAAWMVWLLGPLEPT